VDFLHLLTIPRMCCVVLCSCLNWADQKSMRRPKQPACVDTQLNLDLTRVIECTIVSVRCKICMYAYVEDNVMNRVC